MCNYRKSDGRGYVDAKRHFAYLRFELRSAGLCPTSQTLCIRMHARSSRRFWWNRDQFSTTGCWLPDPRGVPRCRKLLKECVYHVYVHLTPTVHQCHGRDFLQCAVRNTLRDTLARYKYGYTMEPVFSPSSLRMPSPMESLPSSMPASYIDSSWEGTTYDDLKMFSLQ